MDDKEKAVQQLRAHACRSIALTQTAELLVNHLSKQKEGHGHEDSDTDLTTNTMRRGSQPKVKNDKEKRKKNPHSTTQENKNFRLHAGRLRNGKR